MSRSTSFIGLPIPAVNFLATLVCKRTDKTPIATDMTGTIDYFGGIFESKEVNEENKRIFKEVFQFEVWDSGPDIYTCLVEVNKDGSETTLFEWNEKEITKQYDEELYHPSIFVGELPDAMTTDLVKGMSSYVMSHFSEDYIGKCFMIQNSTFYYLGSWMNDIAYQYTKGTHYVNYFDASFIQLKDDSVWYEPRFERKNILYSQLLTSIQEVLMEVRCILYNRAKEKLEKGSAGQ